MALFTTFIISKAFIIKSLSSEILHISNMKVIFISTETVPSFFFHNEISL